MEDRFKFRAWAKLPGQPEWKMHDNIMVGNDSIAIYWLNPAKKVWCWVDITPEYFKLMQSISEKDTNKKLIFEDDIVKCSIKNRLVGWRYASWRLISKHSSLMPGSWEEFEIIGDIHRNPELINA